MSGEPSGQIGSGGRGGTNLATSPPIGEALAFRPGDSAAGTLFVINPDCGAVAVPEVKFGEIAVQMLLVTVLIDADHPALED